MARSTKREFVIHQNGLGHKLIVADPDWITSFMRRVSMRYPKHRWSVSHRFLLNGSD